MHYGHGLLLQGVATQDVSLDSDAVRSSLLLLVLVGGRPGSGSRFACCLSHGHAGSTPGCSSGRPCQADSALSRAATVSFAPNYQSTTSKTTSNGPASSPRKSCEDLTGSGWRAGVRSDGSVWIDLQERRSERRVAIVRNESCTKVPPVQRRTKRICCPFWDRICFRLRSWILHLNEHSLCCHGPCRAVYCV